MQPIAIEEMTPMVPVSDISRSAEFYRLMLGLNVQTRSEGIVLLRRDSMSLYLVAESPPTVDKPGVTIGLSVSPERTPINLTFRVPDVEDAYRRLAARGITFLAPPERKDWGEIRVFTRDPDGYLIELYQPTA